LCPGEVFLKKLKAEVGGVEWGPHFMGNITDEGLLRLYHFLEEQIKKIYNIKNSRFN